MGIALGTEVESLATNFPFSFHGHIWGVSFHRSYVWEGKNLIQEVIFKSDLGGLDSCLHLFLQDPGVRKVFLHRAK
jgi:hypothetical protein